MIIKPITTDTAVTPVWPGLRRLVTAVLLTHVIQSRALNHITGDNTAGANFRPPKLQFDTDRINHSIGSLHLAMLSSLYEWLDLARD